MADQDISISADTTPATGKSALRKRLFLIFGIAIALVALLVLAWQWLFAWRTVSTDNAYVGADVAQVTPRVAGTATAVLVEDTAQVKAGDVLVRLDPSDAQMALDRAEAEFARAEREYRQTAATGQSLLASATARNSDIAAAQAQLQVASANLERTRIDYERRRKLSANGAVSGDELTAATNAYQAAQANMALARAQVRQAQSNSRAAARQAAANLALTAGTTEASSPDVMAARAARDQAKLDLERTVIRAPISGVIARRQVQVGQRISAGTPLMTIVPTDRLYVDANFKEGQLKRVRAGQPATLTSDLYGGNVVYHGHVAGLGGGTGAAFALIPAQNATGNWIKVVQRLPVRIALDPKELAAHPLRVGLSMDAEVDVSGQ
jgi:membrane fusion protein (multidrug efflux system)